MTDHEVSAGPAPSNEQSPGGGWRRWHLTSRDAIIALTVAVLTVSSQAMIDDRREDKADRRENLRFLREQAAADQLQKVQLFNIDLADQNLAGLELQRANMPGVILRKADLSQLRVSESILSEAVMTGADLRESSFQRANLEGAKFHRADLSLAFLGGALLTEADFTGADLSRAVFGLGAGQDQELVYTRFTIADLRGADLENTRFDKVSFYGADLRGAKLSIQPDEVICYDFTTRWPRGFQPPSSAHPRDCRPE